MSHRGKNSVAQSVQVWNGTAWVPLNGLLFADVFSNTPSTVWKGPDGELGYAGPTGLIEGQSEVLDNVSAQTVQAIKKKIRLFLDGPAGTDPTVDYDLPIAVYGVSPTEASGGLNTDRLLARITVMVNRNDGSSWEVDEWLVAWRWDTDATGYHADAEVAPVTTPVNTTLAAAGAGGPPALPRVTFGQAGASDTTRYLVEIDLTLITLNAP